MRLRSLQIAEKNNKLTIISICDIRDERMAQCFPTYATDYPDLMKALKKMVTDGYNERVPVSSPSLALLSLRIDVDSLGNSKLGKW